MRSRVWHPSTHLHSPQPHLILIHVVSFVNQPSSTLLKSLVSCKDDFLSRPRSLASIRLHKQKTDITYRIYYEDGGFCALAFTQRLFLAAERFFSNESQSTRYRMWKYGQEITGSQSHLQATFAENATYGSQNENRQ